MKASIDLKKCEQNLKIVCRAISQKEAEKASLEEACSKRKTEMVTVHNSIRKSNNARNEIKDELIKIRSEVENKHDKMNRIKADLLYKSKRDYEEMIRRLENEMQFNHQSFSSRDEARILRDITKFKYEMTLLESYEEIKRAYDELKEKLATKKHEQDEIWDKAAEYKMSYHNMNEELKSMTKEITEVNRELEELISSKLDLKKKIEDLSREQVAKQQQLKRESLEKAKIDKHFKKDQLILSYEETLRDYNILINYFHKLIYGKEETQEGDTQSFMSNSFSSGVGGYQPGSESSSLASSTNNMQQYNSVLSNLKNELSLGLSRVTNNNLTFPPRGNMYSLEFNETLSPLASPCGSTNSSLTTPIGDQAPFFCGNGEPYIKKKLTESTNSLSVGKKNRKTKKQNKNAKLSHSVEVINLLSKLEIPIQLSSQLPECLKELRQRKEQTINEMNNYKINVEQEKEAQKKHRLLQQQQQQETSNDSLPVNLTNDSSVNSSNIFSDTNSDISSCLDSNYESDNNSVRSNQSNFLLHASGESNKFNSLNINQIEVKSEDLKESVDKLGSQMFTTNASQAPTNSDDSDVTINESSLNEKELKLLSAQLKKNQINKQNALAAQEQHSNVVLNRTKSSPEKNFFTNSDNQNIEIKNNFSFFRQISDGYSSSCTPLSASSITNEQPQVNPFFTVKPATIDKTTDPIEAAFLSTNNLNK